ncbi:alpha/beta hydrolase [Phenylobacterium sp.]|uniref:alpha/beta fold hydrolase n=1 Tax=Phenylobacterium sp. TaxID=1871053 RepID=UPI00286B3145|nr:alpha/beta hydrolase [Phenylobacterium sp.]
MTLAAQSFGTASHPAILLLMGSTASMLGWPDELCLELAAQGFFVVRYDNRDTGLSSTYPPGPPTYAVEDMTGDLLAVMDAYGVGQAHLVGMSLGGLIAQIAALSSPSRVMTLTLIGSEPLGWDGEPLPHIVPAFLDHFSKLAGMDWSDGPRVRAFLLKVEQLCAGSGRPFDAVAAGARVDAVMTRSPNLASAFNHGMVQLRDDWTGRFREIKQPTLVVHGEEDSILPVENGHALFHGIPGARLLVLPGVGHELPPEVIGKIVVTGWLRSQRTADGQHAPLSTAHR